MHAAIVKQIMSFSDVPGNAALQRVWPHNMNLGLDCEGDVVRYERLGSIDVEGLLKQFPLVTSSDEDSTLVSEGSKGPSVSEWRAALERDIAQREETSQNVLSDDFGLGDFVMEKTKKQTKNNFFTGFLKIDFPEATLLMQCRFFIWTGISLSFRPWAWSNSS